MRLSQFIRDNIDPIVAEWAAVAKAIPPGRGLSLHERLDHCKAMLLAIAAEMEARQARAEQSPRPLDGGRQAEPGESPAKIHGAQRQREGFDLSQLAMEFRALRANVLERWRVCPFRSGDPEGIEDITRFNEGVDQALADSIDRYASNLEASRDIFLGVLGHDLRGPLTAISLSAKSMAKPGATEAARAKAGGNVERAVKEMARLISDLLDYTSARIGPGILVEPRPSDLGEVCRLAIEDARASRPDCVFELRAPERLTWRCDAPKMGQALANLLANAAQYGDAGEPVELVAAVVGGEAVVSVRNLCEPIPESARLTMFEPMSRFASPDAEDERSRTSVGLGLFIAREIVAGHGGRLWVESVASGTTFSIALPA